MLTDTVVDWTDRIAWLFGVPTTRWDDRTKTPDSGKLLRRSRERLGRAIAAAVARNARSSDGKQ